MFMHELIYTNNNEWRRSCTVNSKTQISQKGLKNPKEKRIKRFRGNFRQLVRSLTYSRCRRLTDGVLFLLAGLYHRRVTRVMWLFPLAPLFGPSLSRFHRQPYLLFSKASHMRKTNPQTLKDPHIFSSTLEKYFTFFPPLAG